MPQPIVQSVIFQFDTEFDQAALSKLQSELKAVDKQIEVFQKRLSDPNQAKTANIFNIQLENLQKKRAEIIAQGQKFEASLNSSDAAMKKIGTSSALASKALGVLKGALSVAAISAFISKSVQAAAQLEKTSQAFKSFGLSAQKAKQLTQELDTLSSTLPFDNDKIIELSKNLLRFGVSEKDVIATTERLAALSYGAGYSVDALSVAFGNAKEKGKLFGNDFIKLYKNIPGLIESISKVSGKAIDDVIRLGKQGKLSFEDLAAGIELATSKTGKYGQVLFDYNQTFEAASKKLAKSFDDIKQAFGEGLLADATTGVNTLADALDRIKPASETAGKGLAFVLTSLINVLTGKNAFLIQGEIIKGIRDQNNRLKAYLQKQFEELFTDIKSFPKIPPPRDLSAEEKARIDKFFEDLNNAIEESSKRKSDLGLQLISDNSRDFLQKKLKQDVELIEFDFKKQIKGLKDKVAEFQKDGIKIDISTQVKRLENIKDERIKELKIEAQRRIEAQFGILSPIIELDPVYLLKTEAEIDDDIRKIVNTLLLNPLEKQLQEKALKIDLPKVEANTQGGRESPFDVLIKNLTENLNDPKVKTELNKFTKQAIAGVDTFINAELEKTGFLISETEKRLQQLLSIQEGGNSSQIRLEQDRLDKLNDQRQKFVERQKAIDAAQIIANNAVSASESIKAITTAFGKGGNPIVGIAASLALVATIAATVASVNAQFNSIPRFWEGAERVSDKSRPTKSGRDGHLLWADGGERIIPTKFNAQIPSYVKNKDIPSLVEMGIRASEGGMTDRNITIRQDETNRLLRSNQKLLKNQTIKLKILNDSGEQLRLKRMAR